MKKRITSLVMTIALIIALLPQTCFQVNAQTGSGDQAFLDFISAEDYLPYLRTGDTIEGPSQYAILDIDQNGVNELLIGAWNCRGDGYALVYIFMLDSNGEVTYLDWIESYQELSYSSQHKSLVRWERDISISRLVYFYKLVGNKLDIPFSLFLERYSKTYYYLVDGEYWGDNSDKTSIEESEYKAYIDSAASIDWMDIYQIKKEGQESTSAETLDGYEAAINTAIKASKEYPWGDGYGTVHDIDGNGIAELIMVYTAKVKSKEGYEYPAKVCTVYTLTQGKAITLIDEEELYVEAGGSWGYAAVVKKRMVFSLL